MSDWKTTLAGALPILLMGAARAFGIPLTNEETAALTGIFIAALGFLAKDKT